MTTAKESLQPFIAWASESQPRFLGDANALRFNLIAIGPAAGYAGFLFHKPRSAIVSHLVGTGMAVLQTGAKPPGFEQSPAPWTVRLAIALGHSPGVVIGVTFCDFNPNTFGSGAEIRSDESDLRFNTSDSFDLKLGDTSYQLQLRKSTLRN